ncbi:hypothetical protein HYDPIDRAFT_34393 [Hydnomerulius pinastri MD-312]|uniref:Uncharacterized protein n=1 Tax=Hydnomerulius pinastri MD-312 TaxID=994086 RepID=A0A0C9VY01_9AGAM|nr:hypothetical protein HYDPIDRAFT_34393 [Hydnomerulius pinastri MD-312]
MSGGPGVYLLLLGRLPIDHQRCIPRRPCRMGSTNWSGCTKASAAATCTPSVSELKANGDDDIKVSAYNKGHPPGPPRRDTLLSVIEEIDSFVLEMVARKLKVPCTVTLSRFPSKVFSKLRYHVVFIGSWWDTSEYYFKTEERLWWVERRVRFGRNLPIVAHIVGSPVVSLDEDHSGAF